MQTLNAERQTVDETMLDQAIDALDPVVALLTLIQITGDRTLLHRYGDALEGRRFRASRGLSGVPGER